MTEGVWRYNGADWEWVELHRGIAYTVSLAPPPPEERAIGFKAKPVEEKRPIGFRPPRP